MRRLKLPVIVCVAGVTLTAAANAADLPPLDLPPLMKPPQVQELFSSWYLRLDGSYRTSRISSGSAAATSFSSITVEDTPTIGGGFGFKWNWLRSDVTVDYGGQGKLTSNSTLGSPTVTQRDQNVTTLVNAYLDLGTWAGFTPYVGAGAGYTYIKPTDFKYLGNPINISNSDWNFTWAAMAGISYAFTPSWMIDASYRYLDMGSTSTIVPGVGTVGYRDWTASEIRVGLRYLIP